jgi:uncharacterized protein (TIGR02594 family)
LYLMTFRQLRVLGISTIAISIFATAASADIGGSENIKDPAAGVSQVAKSKSKKITKRQARAEARANARQVRQARVAARSQSRAASRTKAVHAYAAVPSSSSLVSEARRHLGTNPTNRRSLWCGAFMDMVLKRTGHKGGGNLARGYAKYGTRISGPRVGAIAVMTRGKRGGHVGVVSGVDEKGNVIVVSGNHNNTVAESVYPRSRIIAYVMPNAS